VSKMALSAKSSPDPNIYDDTNSVPASKDHRLKAVSDAASRVFLRVNTTHRCSVLMGQPAVTAVGRACD
jgi:hypothetical protein